MIEVKNLFLKYIREYYALYDISLHVDKGEVVAIIGEEQSGKTSLLRVLAKLEKFNKGEVYIKDIALKKLNLACDVSMAYLPEKPLFLRNKTVYQNFFYLLKSRKYEQKNIESKINEAMIEYNIERLKDTKIEDLSLVDVYIVSLIRFTFRDVEIALIDNIFDKLSDEEKESIISLIKYIFVKKKTTLIIATTQEKIAKEFKAKCVFFENGSIVKSKKKEEETKK